jgi:NTP pyrophosphatase (non-canonical NTP hydrolase)
MIKLDDYQQAASDTAIYPGKGTFSGVTYCTLKLNGEAGEIAEKVGKALRDADGIIDEDRRSALKLELGDVLWYVANLAKELDYSLSEIAQANIDKLASRKARGTLKGDGDNR